MSATYYVSSEARLTVKFYDITGVNLVDPTTITIKVRNPAGTETSHTYGVDVTKDAVGIYHYDQVFNLAGVWYYRGIGTGAVKAAAEKRIVVQVSPFDTP